MLKIVGRRSLTHEAGAGLGTAAETALMFVEAWGPVRISCIVERLGLRKGTL